MCEKRSFSVFYLVFYLSVYYPRAIVNFSNEITKNFCFFLCKQVVPFHIGVTCTCLLDIALMSVTEFVR